MGTTIEEFEQDGWRATVAYDMEPASPADWTRVGTLAYSTRNANYGDMPSDPYGVGPFMTDCPKCDGDGEWYIEDEDGARTDETATCPHCKGECYVTDGAALAAHTEGAIVTLPVRAVDGQMGTELSIADDWEHANGWIYATPTSVAETLGADATPEQIAEALKGELEAWEQWAQGDVYGYIVTAPVSHDVADSCWGFYDLDDAIVEARASMSALIRDRAHQETKINAMMRL